MATVPPTAEGINVRLYASLGDVIGAERIVLDHTEASSVTGNQASVIPVEIAGAGTNTQVNLASYVDTATWVTVKDRGGTGFKISLVNTGTKFEVPASGVFAFKNAAATPPLLYIDNGNASDKAFLEVTVLGSST